MCNLYKFFASLLFETISLNLWKNTKIKTRNSSKNERSQFLQKFESVVLRDVWKNTNAGFVNFQKPKAMRSLGWGCHVKIELCFEKYESELFFFGNKMTQLGSEPLGFVKIELYGQGHENLNFYFGKGMFANKASALDFKKA